MANNWLEFYPALVGNFHHYDTVIEKNPIGDDHYYFHHARVMVFFLTVPRRCCRG
ncbi:hypothetical protein [Corynebacterium tuberculostearicum]|mgnify:CR=1 FL=1|uniref:hypothetical protein n=1 Tax=Corynebacterium tuberculostearicum TaxID=38304 RepID=UPI00264769BC|nr:hypothetical protein [Corynebacterium tuberculostearicum]WKE60366.1 hypothetical protein KAH61_04420 [Corynebacterium tuberculostearicum]